MVGQNTVLYTSPFDHDSSISKHAASMSEILVMQLLGTMRILMINCHLGKAKTVVVLRSCLLPVLRKLYPTIDNTRNKTVVSIDQVVLLLVP